MNSQSLPRLLSRDQSTAFDPRKSWEFDFDGRHYANASFADELGFVVVMPQGWDGNMRPGWSRPRLERVRAARLAPWAEQLTAAADPERFEFLWVQTLGYLVASVAPYIVRAELRLLH